jgi:hypothetical protein
MSWQVAFKDRDVRHDLGIRSSLNAPTSRECSVAAETLRRVAACREAGGELRPLYLRVADLMDVEARKMAAVTR